MSTGEPARPARGRLVLLLAPVVFALHVYEEYPAFIGWMNRRVDPPLTPERFAAINGTAFVITLALAWATALLGGRALALALVAWLGFLMLGNGILHLLATALDGAYAPGALTAAVLYLPYFAIAFAACRRIGGDAGAELGRRPALVAAALGALPMFLQGASILGAGRRLLW
jgi:hypothetical protein